MGKQKAPDVSRIQVRRTTGRHVLSVVLRSMTVYLADIQFAFFAGDKFVECVIQVGRSISNLF